MSDDGGLVPLKVQLPDLVGKYFKILRTSEAGPVKESYDSNFMQTTIAHFTPFDVIMWVKVKRSSPKPVAFWIWAQYQALDSAACMPPRTFEVPMTVIGQKPVMLKLAEARTRSFRKDLAVTDGLR